MARILFYDDAAGFGGHEIMALRIAKGLLELGADISFAYAKGNRMLAQECARLEKVEACPLPLRLHRFSYLTNAVDRERQRVVRRFLREVRPDCLVAVQGTIEVSSLGLFAARKENVKALSYLAFTQNASRLGLSHAPVRDAIDRFYYRLPDRIVTISAAQKENLVRNGIAESRIGVVENVVGPGSTERLGGGEARDLVGLDRSGKYVGIVGRVVFRHKGHLTLVRAVTEHRKAFEGAVIVVVGDGEDLEKLKRKIAESGLEKKFRFLPWSGDLRAVYSALDAVVLPSNHEGVPLVMIEAVLHGIPVVASDIDGMKEYLPPEWLFAKGDAGELAAKVARALGPDRSELSRELLKARDRFETVFLRGTLGREFLDEIRTATVSG